MPITVADALKKVKEQNFQNADALSLINDSIAQGKHPHEHIMDWAVGGGHIAGTDRDRSKIAFTATGMKIDTSSVFNTTAQALTALVYELNTNAGELALTRLNGQAANSRVTIHSRSGAYGSSYALADRWNNFLTDEIVINQGKAEWVTTVFQKIGGNLVIVTHFPNAGGGGVTPAHQCDLVEYVGGTANCNSSESYTGTAVRSFRWLAGTCYWIKHNTVG